MEVNRISNTNFQGGLKIIGGENCTQYLLGRLSGNRFVQAFKSGSKKNLEIFIKHREATDREIKRLSRDDDLYKIIFRSSYPEDTWYGKLLNFFFARSARLAKDFDHHSEHTNIRYLADEKRMKRIFDKLS